jgi:SAM-dependent methyltransferase
LEVGPGSGQFLDYLGHVGADAVGVEPNLVAVRQCEKRGLQVIHAPFEEALLAESKLSAGEMDSVVFLESVYHLFDLRAALGLAHSLLRPGGHLILKAFDVDSIPIRCFRAASGGIDGLGIPINASVSCYGKLLGRSGFEVRRVYRHTGGFLDCLGLEREAIRGAGARLSLKVVDRAADIILRVLRQSRNFALFAQKR